jgi:CelD/BcsL family acetyltransferase involved in cellulose biosynthesis
MLQIEEVNSTERFRSLEIEWMDLLNKSSSNTVFLTFCWLYEWWEVFKKNKELKILLIRDHHNIVGIAPFFIHKTRYGNIFPLTEIKFLGCEEVGSDYLDLIIEQGREEEVLDAVFDYLKHRIKKWDCITLDSFSADSKNVNVLKERNQKKEFYFNVRNDSLCPFINLPKTWDDYVSSLSSNMRYNIKRKTKKLERENDVEFKLIKEKEQLDEAIENFIHLNRERLNSKKIEGAFRVTSFMQFQRQIIQQLFEKGILKLYFLLVNKSPIACLYILDYNNKYLYYQAGLDPQWEKFSPGTVLFAFCIQQAIEREMEEFDFLRGVENYKNSWAKNRKSILEIKMFKKSIKNKIIFSIEKQRPKIGNIKRRIFNIQN